MNQALCAAPANPSEEKYDDLGRGSGRVRVEVGA
jgi:hypothetical protein